MIITATHKQASARHILCLLLLLLSLPLAARAQHQSNKWRGSHDSDWHNAANWSLGRVPQIGDMAVILADRPHEPEVTGIAYCSQLKFEQGTGLKLGEAARIEFGKPKKEESLAERNKPAELSWELYPNPSTHGITLHGKQAPGTTYRLLSREGRSQPLKITEQSDHGLYITLTDLPPGLYYLQITSPGEGPESIPFVKQ